MWRPGDRDATLRRAKASLNLDAGVRSQPREEAVQRGARQRDAAGRRRKSGPRHMDEHRAAAPGDARAGIVIELDQQVVELVAAGQAVAALAAGRAGSAGCSAGRPGPRTRRRPAQCGGPAGRSADARRGRPATTGAPAGNGRAGSRRRPHACWREFQNRRARPAAPAARRSARRAPVCRVGRVLVMISTSCAWSGGCLPIEHAHAGFEHLRTNPPFRPELRIDSGER